MLRPRWPDVVIVISIIMLGCAGVWAIWGEDLGLREQDKAEKKEPPLRRVEGGGSMS
ncbi:MAG: hypothetical protein K8M05_31680 [Deltaproteobacteria bacterium]|nr:hypothetical protein [Kofleriaceae bacterium]